MPAVGPVILTVLGDTYTDPATIHAFVWEGATTAGDTVEVRHRTDDSLLWAGRATGSQTYIGLAMPWGVHAPGGFRLTKIPAGRVLVYLRET